VALIIATVVAYHSVKLPGDVLVVLRRPAEIASWPASIPFCGTELDV
jgi:hypothetical protein